jgi:hypothetical protein
VAICVHVCCLQRSGCYRLHVLTGDKAGTLKHGCGYVTALCPAETRWPAGRRFVSTEFQLKATDWTIQGSNRGGSKRFFICRPGLGPTKSHVQWVPAVNRPERDCDHSGPFRGELDKYYTCHSHPLLI